MPKVLIVDDSPAQLYSLRQMVERAGHQAVVAESGERALEVAASEHPAVILMDIVMPGMSGYQATRKLGRTESTRHIPVIFVSTRDGEADRQWGLRQGAREYVTKPVNPNLLLAAISEAMAA
ncbi:PleD family two-component system response regulator [Pseudomonadota bacterium]|jgi:twitching motility two-component system response regulator PilH|nr:response regulator [Xanthomonadales bacterium]